MTFAALPQSTHAKIEQEAAEWLARFDALERLPDTPEAIDLDHLAQKDQAFAAWLSDNLEHRIAFLRLWHVWSVSDRLKAVGDSNGAHAQTRKPRVWRGAFLVAACAALIAVFITSRQTSPAPVTPAPLVFATTLGEFEQVALADGSIVDLDTDTELRVALDGPARQIQLHAGQAYFDVAPDKERPFLIDAGDVSVRVVGTEFSVHRTASAHEIIVTEGQVSLSWKAQPDIRLVAGMKARLDDRGLTVTDLTEADLTAALGWRSGRLFFKHTRLDEAVQAFNRYNETKLFVIGEDVSAMEIGGTFANKDIEAFATALETSFGLDIERSDRLIILRGKKI